jgi:phage shock protein A
MALIRRVSRLFAADMHAVLDQIEEPETLIRQALREMEEELARQQQREKWLGKEIEGMAARVEGFKAQTAELDASLDICLANGNEDLARRLVRRKLELSQSAARAADRHDALSQQLSELRDLMATHRDQLEGMRQKAAVLALDEVAAAGSDGPRPRIDETDVEIALLREKQARAAS